jgi:hypothetical protein
MPPSDHSVDVVRGFGMGDDVNRAPHYVTVTESTDGRRFPGCPARVRVSAAD